MVAAVEPVSGSLVSAPASLQSVGKEIGHGAYSEARAGRARARASAIAAGARRSGRAEREAARVREGRELLCARSRNRGRAGEIQRAAFLSALGFVRARGALDRFSPFFFALRSFRSQVFVAFAPPKGRRLALKRSYLEPDGSLPAPLVREISAFTALADSAPGKRARLAAIEGLCGATGRANRREPDGNESDENAQGRCANGAPATTIPVVGPEGVRALGTSLGVSSPREALPADRVAATIAPGSNALGAASAPVSDALCAVATSGASPCCPPVRLSDPLAWFPTRDFPFAPPLGLVREPYAIALALPLARTDLGSTLRARRRRGLPPPEPAAIRGMARGLLRALAVCAAAGVAHRDVAPGNVLLWSDGRVALGDFGSAQVDEEAQAEGGRANGAAAGRAVRADKGVVEKHLAAPSAGTTPVPSVRAPSDVPPKATPGLDASSPRRSSPADAGASPLPNGSDPASAGTPPFAGGSGPAAASVPSFDRAPSSASFVCTSPPFATRWYAAPELLLGAKSYLALPADLWAVGALLCELAAGVPPFRASTDLGIVGALVAGVGPPPSKEDWPTREKDCPDLLNLRLERLAQREIEDDGAAGAETDGEAENAPQRGGAESRALVGAASTQSERGSIARAFPCLGDQLLPAPKAASVASSDPSPRSSPSQPPRLALRRLRRHLERVANSPPPPNDAPAVRVTDDGLLGLALRLMRYDPRRRPTAQEALRDAYFGTEAAGEDELAAREATEREAVAAFVREALLREI